MENNKQWILETLAHRNSGRVPYNFMFSPPARRVLEAHYQTDKIEERFNFPIRMSVPSSIKPLYAEPDTYGPIIKDEFGVMWTTSYIDRGAPIGPCLRKPDLTHYRFPDAHREYRFSGLPQWCEENSLHYTIIWVGDLWERATFMCSMEKLLTYVVTDDSFVEALLHGITDYILQTMDIVFERCKFDGIALSDDYGAQNAILISPDAWRRFVKPCLKKIYGLAKKNGRSVLHHSCGNLIPVIPDMIGMGLDILHPIQPEAMDVFRLKAEFGMDLTLCGGLGTQKLLPYGSPKQVRDEVKRLKDLLGRDGGYILEPGITIQADVPLGNLTAMIEEALTT